MIYIILILTFSCINCFENNKLYPASNKLFKLFEKNNEEKTFSKNKTFYEPAYSDNLFLSYHKWIKKENKPINDDELLQEELKQIYKNNYQIFKNMEKHNKKRKI